MNYFKKKFKMHIQVQSPNFVADPLFENVIINQLELLEKKFPRIDSCVVTLRQLNSDTKFNKVIELKMTIPRGKIFLAERSDSFGLALKNLMNNLKRRMKKVQEKNSNKKRIKISIE